MHIWWWSLKWAKKNEIVFTIASPTTTSVLKIGVLGQVIGSANKWAEMWKSLQNLNKPSTQSTQPSPKFWNNFKADGVKIHIYLNPNTFIDKLTLTRNPKSHRSYNHVTIIIVTSRVEVHKDWVEKSPLMKRVGVMSTMLQEELNDDDVRYEDDNDDE